MPRPKKANVSVPQPESSKPTKLCSNAPKSSLPGSLNGLDTIFSNWTIDECNRLVSFIKKNGFDGDVKKISGQFPGHTETNIRHFMTELCPKPGDSDSITDKLACKFGSLQEQARVNSLSQSYGSVLPLFTEWKALFESHPKPEDCGGVDYADIYRTIAALMRGEIPRALNKPTAQKFLQIIHNVMLKMKSPPPDLPDPKTYKKPVGSTIKNRAQCNVTLANRRSTTWSKGEIEKAKMLLTGDLKVAREVYLTPAWANPFRFPDEPSRMRQLKIEQRKCAGDNVHHQPDQMNAEPASFADVAEQQQQGPAPKKRRYRRK